MRRIIYVGDTPRINGTAGADTLIGTDAPDPDAGSNSGDSSDEPITAPNPHDIIVALDGPDLINGLHGDDVLYGNQADDTMFGGYDADTLYGGQGNDIMFDVEPEAMGMAPDRAPFVAYGNQGDDMMIAGDGPAWMHGGAGHDALMGGDGADTLNGGRGDDALVGGAGLDVYVIQGGGHDIIQEDDFLRGGGVIHLAAGSVRSFADVIASATVSPASSPTMPATQIGYTDADGQPATLTLIGLAPADLRAEVFTFAARTPARAAALDGADTITGSDAADLLSGGAGNDVLYGAGGDDALYGNQGDDTVFGGRDADTVYGGQGDDRIYDLTRGELDSDWLRSDMFYAYGNMGDDVMFADNGPAWMHGGAGNDWLSAGQGAATLCGGAGDDTLNAGYGPDIYVLSGGGADTVYVWKDELDDGVRVVTDRFEVTTPHLLSYADLAAGMRATPQAYGGAATTIAYTDERGQAASVLLIGVAPADLTEGMFVFR